MQPPEHLITDTYIQTEHFRLHGEDLVRIFRECVDERPYSLYTIPCFADPRWPMLTMYFSKQRWTDEQLEQFAEGNLAALTQRAKNGEGVIGFQYDIRYLTKIEPLSNRARAFLPSVQLP